MSKLAVTFIFLVTVVSFPGYSPARLAPFVFYPVLMAALSDTPWRLLMGRMALALPFVLLAGISGVILDRAPAFMIGTVAVSRGVVYFFSLIYRCFLCVSAILILVAVTPFSKLTGELRRLRVPALLVTVFEMTYRYLGALFDEISSMYTAYLLRSQKAHGVNLRDAGSFVGQLLIRSFARAERVYAAMKCRGYNASVHPANAAPLKNSDIIFMLVCTLCFFSLRIFNVPAIFSQMIGRWF